MATPQNPKAQPAANTVEDTEVTLQKLLEEHGLSAEEAQPAPVEAIDTEAQDVQKVDRQFDLSNNPFQEVVFSPDLTNEEKKEALVKLLSFDECLDEEGNPLLDDQGYPIDAIALNKQRQQQFELFKSSMMDERKRMAQDIIHLTDKDTYAELAKMYKQIASEMSNYRKQLKPLLDIVNAVSAVRAQGKLVDVYDSFDTDKQGKAKYDFELEQATKFRDKDAARLDEIKKALALANEDTTPRILGIGGGIRKRSRMKIAELELELEKLNPRLETEKALVDKLVANPFVESLPELREQKKIVKELIELGAEQHRDRIQSLIDTAENFINTTDVRGHAVLDSHIRRREHIANLTEGNNGLTDVYALLSDATKEAAKSNDAVYEKYKTVPADEDAMDQIVRERTRDAVSIHIKDAKRSQKDTEQVRGELETQKLTLFTTNDNNESNIVDARALVGSVNAQVAEGLATALDAVTGAATDLSRLVAEDINKQMKQQNLDVIAGEVTRMADNSEHSADKLKEASELLGQFLKLTDDTANRAKTGEANADAALNTLDQMRKKLEEKRTSLISAPAESGKSSKFNAVSPPPANDSSPEAAASHLANNKLSNGLRSKPSAKKPKV